MQDSLISRKAVLELIWELIEISEYDGDKILFTKDEVENLPIAYDLDKVVERLEERKADREKEYKTASLQDGSYMLSMVFRESAKAYERGIEIVKGGGVDAGNNP